MTSDLSLDGLMRWRCVGPFRGGRVVAVAGSYSDRNTFYFGGCAGGISKPSTPAHLIRRNVSDGFFTTSSVGAIAVAPSDSNVIYVCTPVLRRRAERSPPAFAGAQGVKSWASRARRHRRSTAAIVAGQLGAALLALEQVADARRQRRALAGGALDRVGELGGMRGGQRDHRNFGRQIGARARRGGRSRCAGRSPRRTSRAPSASPAPSRRRRRGRWRTARRRLRAGRWSAASPCVASKPAHLRGERRAVAAAESRTAAARSSS